jgi:aspartate racemase
MPPIGATPAPLLAANSPHIVSDRVQARSPLPLVSIVEATRDEALRLGLKRLALFGTRYTRHGSFYQDVFGRSGLALVVPDVPSRHLFTRNTWASW